MNDCRDCANVDNEYCFACNDGNQFKPMTNGDRIRAMTDEELAAWLEDRTMLPINGLWLDWLKQEADDDKSGQDQRDDG